MSKIKDISKQPLIEWGGQIVITTAQLAEVYGATPDNISDNFARNKSRFKEGKRYILLEREALKEFKNYSAESGLVAKNARQLYLWTRRGASRHCKILGTDKAWEQFDYLEDKYFDRAEKRQAPPLTLKEQVQTIAQATTELYEQVDKVAASIDDVKSEIETIKNDLPLLPIGADKIKNAVNKRVASLLGGKQSGAYKDESLRAKVFINCHRNLKSNFEGIRSYKEIRQKDTEKAVKIINEYTPPLSLAEQIKMANAQQSFNFEEDEINSRYYNIGLIIGALRAELEKGTVSLESAYGLLTDGVKAAIDSELIHKGGTVK